MSGPIRLLLADDQALVRGALAALLSLEPDLEVVSEVARGDEVVAAALEHRPHVALLDVEMPGTDGITAAAALATALPTCRVLIVTTFGRPGYLRRALAVGAAGFVVKDTPAAQLADAVRRVHAGLQRNAVGASEPVKDIMSAIPGIDLDAQQWPYIGAKAGNLPGDLTFSWYAVDRTGQAWVVSFQLNWPRYHGPSTGAWVMSIVKQVFGMLPRQG